MSARQLPKRDYRLLKSETHELIDCLTGRGAARATRVGQQTLSKYADRKSAEYSEYFIPIDVVADLEAELGDFPVTRALAELNNCLLVPLPEGKTGGRLQMAMGITTTEFGQMLESWGAGMADGHLDKAEKTVLLKECADVMQRTAEFMELVKAEPEENQEQET